MIWNWIFTTDVLIVLHVVTHNIGRLEGVHLVKFDKKPNFNFFLPNAPTKVVFTMFHLSPSSSSI